MDCKITRGRNNEILYVEAPNGEASVLFQDAKELVQTDQEALNVWKAGNSPLYNEQVLTPQIEEYKTEQINRLNTLSAPTQIEIIHRKKQHSVKVTYTEKEAFVRVGQEKVILGKINTIPFQEGVKLDIVLTPRQVYSSGKIESLKDIDLGLYKKYIPQATVPIYKNGNDSLWNSFTAIGIASQNTISPTPNTIDQNGEPVVEEVLKFIDRKNLEAQLSETERSEIKLALTATNLQNSDELYSALTKGFFVNKIFAPTKRSLQNAGIYTEAEINNILQDQQLQDNIKDLYYKLQNTEFGIDNDIYTNSDFITSSGFSANIIGKYNIENPYINEQEAIQTLGGVRTLEEFEDALFNSDLEYLKEQYKNPNNTLYEFFSGFNKLSVKDEQLNDLPTVDTLSLFEQTLLEPQNNLLEQRLLVLGGVSTLVWETSPQEVKTLLEDLQTQATDISLDLSGIADQYDVKSKAEFNSFFGSFNQLLNNYTEQGIADFATTYNSFFDVNTNPKQEVVQVATQHRNKALVYIDTNLTAYEMFSQNGLLPIQEDVWQKTNGNTAELENTYEIIYETVKQNPNILPREAYGSAALDRQGNFDRSKLNSLTNKPAILNNIRNWVFGQMKNVNTGTAIVDNATLQKMVLYSQYYFTPKENIKYFPDTQQDVGLVINPISNVEYLTTDFVADFHKKIIKEKQKNSEDYQNFYSHFAVDKDGLYLADTDPVTREQITPYLLENEDIRNYLLLRKDTSLNLPTDEEVIEDDSFLRQYYRNYPQALEEFTGDYTRVNSTTVIAAGEKFIKVKGMPYEIAENGIYNALGINNSAFKEYNEKTVPSQMSVNPLAFVEVNSESPISTNNTYSKAQSEDIQRELQNCT